MFTGIIEEVGHATDIVDTGGTRRLSVSATKSAKQLKRGGSIAVSGVCLTADEVTPEYFSADLAEETWNRTSISRIKPSDLVNIKLPNQANRRFDGHIVKVHV